MVRFNCDLVRFNVVVVRTDMQVQTTQFECAFDAIEADEFDELVAEKVDGMKGPRSASIAGVFVAHAHNDTELYEQYAMTKRGLVRVVPQEVR